jgi:hypothetical protein
MAAPAVVATFGCFSYARPSNDRIRLHFENADTDRRSSLAMERRDERLADLAALFESGGEFFRVVIDDAQYR